MTSQGIEAATADKTRSGLAEGESPVRQDAPNPLYQEGYSMTDTTDFVLVPRKLTDDMHEAVVKLDFHSTHDPLWPEYWAAMIDAAPTPEPVPSDLDRFIAEIHKATPNGEYILVKHHPNGDWSVSRKCEPVPATNQVGEVEQYESDRLKIARALGERFIARGNARVTGSGYKTYDEMPYSYTVDFLADAEAVLAALATQPATSQQGKIDQEKRDAEAAAYGERHRGERDAFDEMQKIKAGDWDSVISKRLSVGTATALKEPQTLFASARGHLANIRAHGNAEANACLVIERALDTATALATQPATSQEGEGCTCGNDRLFMKIDGVCTNCGKGQTTKFAATPTPPILSEDLREATVTLNVFLAGYEAMPDDEVVPAEDLLTWGQLRTISAALARPQGQAS
jgi:hypothetical protein